MDSLIFLRERICRFAEYSKEAYGMLLVSVFVVRETREERKERERASNRREIFFENVIGFVSFCFSKSTLIDFKKWVRGDVWDTVDGKI